MWHAIASVGNDHDPILYESLELCDLLVFNSGPGTVIVRGWAEVEAYSNEAKIKIELRAGDQRIVGGRLIRAHLLQGKYASVAWRHLSEKRQ